MIKAVMKVAVQEISFPMVRGDKSVVIPECRDCRILLVEHLDGFPKILVG